MVRLLTTTALLVAVSTNAYANTAAEGIRDQLRGVYDSYGTTWDLNADTRDAYADLLHGLDNPGQAEVKAVEGKQIQNEDLFVDGRMVASIEVDTGVDGSPSTLIDLDELIQNFVTEVDGDVAELTGQSVARLTTAVTDYNTKAVSGTVAERDLALAAVNTVLDEESSRYNGALDALAEVEETDFTTFALGGIPFGYTSYTDFVTNTTTPVSQKIGTTNVESHLLVSLISQDEPAKVYVIAVDGQEFTIDTNSQSVTAPNSDVLTLAAAPDGVPSNDLFQRSIDQAEIWLAAQ